MRILNNSYTTQNLFRYCLNCNRLSSFSPKSQNPNYLETVLPANLLFTISILCNYSSGSSSFLSADSYPLQKKPFISSASSGFLPLLHFGLNSVRKKQSLGISSSGSASNFFSNPYLPSTNHYLINSSSWLSSRLCSFAHLYKCHRVCSSSGCVYSGNMHRSFTASFSSETSVSGPVVDSEVQSVANICSDQLKLEKRNKFPRKFVLEIVDILRNNGKDLEPRLNLLSSRLSIYSITEIFEVLNSQRISGLRFFEWIWSNNPPLHKNACICSLAIDNFGRLDDYETMFSWLKKFTSEKICLTYEAFAFLAVMSSPTSSLKESTIQMVNILNKVGGSSRNSGICALVEMFCKLDLFDMATYVIEITESKESYYCLMIREKCRRGLVEDAYSIIREMGDSHFAPTTRVYNYLLGSLWKNGKPEEASRILDRMKEIGIRPDAITFEILINFVCRLGKMDDVRHLLNEMSSQGLEPRIATHACIIKTLFAAGKYEEAYKYVVDSSSIYKTSSNMMYSLMANLYREKGDITRARSILVEMMENGLKPNFSIYLKIVKQLRRTARGNLARDLESRIKAVTVFRFKAYSFANSRSPPIA